MTTLQELQENTLGSLVALHRSVASILGNTTRVTRRSDDIRNARNSRARLRRSITRIPRCITFHAWCAWRIIFIFYFLNSMNNKDKMIHHAHHVKRMHSWKWHRAMSYRCAWQPRLPVFKICRASGRRFSDGGGSVEPISQFRTKHPF